MYSVQSIHYKISFACPLHTLIFLLTFTSKTTHLYLTFTSNFPAGYSIAISYGKQEESLSWNNISRNWVWPRNSNIFMKKWRIRSQQIWISDWWNNSIPCIFDRLLLKNGTSNQRNCVLSFKYMHEQLQGYLADYVEKLSHCCHARWVHLLSICGNEILKRNTPSNFRQSLPKIKWFAFFSRTTTAKYKIKST